jgi:hypothetical protein
VVAGSAYVSCNQISNFYLIIFQFIELTSAMKQSPSLEPEVSLG